MRELCARKQIFVTFVMIGGNIGQNRFFSGHIIDYGVINSLNPQMVIVKINKWHELTTRTLGQRIKNVTPAMMLEG